MSDSSNVADFFFVVTLNWKKSLSEQEKEENINKHAGRSVVEINMSNGQIETGSDDDNSDEENNEGNEKGSMTHDPASRSSDDEDADDNGEDDNDFCSQSIDNSHNASREGVTSMKKDNRLSSVCSLTSDFNEKLAVHHPLKQKYDASVTFRTPSEDREKANFPTFLPMFVFPNDLTLYHGKEPPKPTFHSFVITEEIGTKIYGVTVIVYKPLSINFRNELSERVDQWKSMCMTPSDEDYINHLRKQLKTTNETIARISAEISDPIELENDLDYQEAIDKQAVFKKMLDPLVNTALVDLDHVYVPIGYGLLSHWPFYDFFKDWLCEFLRIIKTEYLEADEEKDENKPHIPLERYVTNVLDEIPLPPPGKLEVSVHVGDLLLYLHRPPINRIPVIKNFSLFPFFRCLSAKNIVRLFELALTEHKMLFISSHTSILNIAMESLCLLMYPFAWHYILIPVLPDRLESYLQAPVPFMVGVTKQTIFSEEIPEDVVIIDLDRNLIRTDSHAPHLPSTERKKLLSRISKYANMERILLAPTMKILSPLSALPKKTRRTSVIGSKEVNVSDIFLQAFPFNRVVPASSHSRKEFLERRKKYKALNGEEKTPDSSTESLNKISGGTDNNVNSGGNGSLSSSTKSPSGFSAVMTKFTRTLSSITNTPLVSPPKTTATNEKPSPKNVDSPSHQSGSTIEKTPTGAGTEEASLFSSMKKKSSFFNILSTKKDASTSAATNGNGSTTNLQLNLTSNMNTPKLIRNKNQQSNSNSSSPSNGATTNSSATQNEVIQNGRLSSRLRFTSESKTNATVKSELTSLYAHSLSAVSTEASESYGVLFTDVEKHLTQQHKLRLFGHSFLPVSPAFLNNPNKNSVSLTQRNNDHDCEDDNDVDDNAEHGSDSEEENDPNTLNQNSHRNISNLTCAFCARKFLKEEEKDLSNFTLFQCVDCGVCVEKDCLVVAELRPCTRYFNEEKLQNAFFKVFQTLLKPYKQFLLTHQRKSSHTNNKNNFGESTNMGNNDMSSDEMDETKSKLGTFGTHRNSNEGQAGDALKSMIHKGRVVFDSGDEVPDVWFDTQKFLNALDRETRQFMMHIVDTQAFNQFTLSRVMSTNDYEILFFDESLEQKLNRSVFRVTKVATPFLDDPSFDVQTVFHSLKPSATVGFGMNYTRNEQGYLTEFDPLSFGTPRYVQKLVTETDQSIIRSHTSEILRRKLMSKEKKQDLSRWIKGKLKDLQKISGGQVVAFGILSDQDRQELFDSKCNQVVQVLDKYEKTLLSILTLDEVEDALDTLQQQHLFLMSIADDQLVVTDSEQEYLALLYARLFRVMTIFEDHLSNLKSGSLRSSQEINVNGAGVSVHGSQILSFTSQLPNIQISSTTTGHQDRSQLNDSYDIQNTVKSTGLHEDEISMKPLVIRTTIDESFEKFNKLALPPLPKDGSTDSLYVPKTVTAPLFSLLSKPILLPILDTVASMDDQIPSSLTNSTTTPTTANTSSLTYAAPKTNDMTAFNSDVGLHASLENMNGNKQSKRRPSKELQEFLPEEIKQFLNI